MRIVFLSLSLFLMLLMAGCEKDEERESLPVEGTWSLLLYANGEHEEAYNKNDIIWKFNKYNELVVTMNIELPDTSELPVKEDGVYPYVASPEVISLEGTQYAVSREGNTLILDHNSAAGGFYIQLELVEE